MYICILKRKTGHILLKTAFDVNILSASNNYHSTCSSYFSWLSSVLGFSNGLRKGFEKYPHPSITEGFRGVPQYFVFQLTEASRLHAST